MNKEQYLINKGKLPDPKFGVLHIVHSTREGVSLTTQSVWNIEKGTTRKRYLLNDAPFEVDIIVGETSSEDSGHGTGIGDLWSWSYFSFLNEDEAKEKYRLESIRVAEKYKK